MVWRTIGHSRPATPHSAFSIQHSALTPPPHSMKRLAILLPLLAATAAAAAADPDGVEAAPPPSVAFPAGPSGE